MESNREKIARLEAQAQDLREEQGRKEKKEADAEREKTLKQIDQWEAGQREATASAMAALREDLVALKIVWNKVCATEAGARVLQRAFGYSFEPKITPAHALAGTSLQGRARFIGAAEEHTLAALLDAEERRQLDDIALRAADSRIGL